MTRPTPHLPAEDLIDEVVYLLVDIAASFHDYPGEDEIRTRAALNACRLMAAHNLSVATPAQVACWQGASL